MSVEKIETNAPEKVRGFQLNKVCAEVVFVLIPVICMIALAVVQPFGDPPDEINRFKVAYYICNHGRLPIGSDPEILLDGYGASYAYQPILTYIIQGWVMRAVQLFTRDSYALIVAARMVNVLLGAGCAVVLRRIAKLLWSNEWTGWLFSLFVMYLPQHLFLYTYINTDAMALFGSAVLLWMMLRGMQNDFDTKTCIGAAVGVILVGLSYYNAYVIVLCAMIWFFYDRIRKKDLIGLRNKTGLIAGIVILGMGWWFIRNAILYQGDFLGLTARQLCAMETAAEEFNPLTRFTYSGAGIPIRDMLFGTDYILLTWQSFVAMFGAMNIPTHGLIYIFYRDLYLICLACLLIPQLILWKVQGKKHVGNGTPESEKAGHLPEEKTSVGRFAALTLKGSDRILWDILMLMDILLTMALHLYYSYTWEYQPQGRYLLPMVFALMYFLTLGVDKLEWGVCTICDRLWKKPAIGRCLSLIGKCGMMLFLLAVLVYTIFVKVIPAYPQDFCLGLLHTVPFENILP